MATNNVIQDGAAPAKVSAKIKLSATDKAAAQKLVEQCDRATESLDMVVSYAGASSQRVLGEFAVGNCSLIEAITAAVIQGDSGKAIIQELRSACKGAIRSAEGQAGKYLVPLEQAKYADASSKAKALEVSEREAAAAAGVVFLPSATIEAYLSAANAAETRIGQLASGCRVSIDDLKAVL